MDIKSFKLTNFKAFADTQRVQLKPITLLYGANSSGKSSVIHSLLLAGQGCATGEIDVHYTKIGGESVDLGGFNQYKHKDSQKPVDHVELAFEYNSHRSIDEVIWSDCIKIKGDKGKNVNISSYEHIYNPANKVIFEQQNNKNIIKFDQFHLGYDLGRIMSDELKKYKKNRYDEYYRNVSTMLTKDYNVRYENLLPVLYSNNIGGIDHKIGRQDIRPGIKNPTTKLLMYFLEQYLDMVEAIRSTWMNDLQNMKYLGPLRSYPNRHIIYKGYRENKTNDSGNDAWEELFRREMRDKVNHWLTSREKLQQKYRIEDSVLLPMRETGDEGHYEDDNEREVYQELIFRSIDRNGTAESLLYHRDIGFGISQILPVLVYAYASNDKLIAIEQPEIHLHPAVQAELGDLFIETALGQNKNTYLLESHSEHLLLRIMRRIRDTKRGTLPKGLLPIKPEDVNVLFVERIDDRSILREMPINEDGELVKTWPGGFFEEELEELL